MAEIPVYFFTGFMDSGKTTLIQETLFENGFAEDDDRILIIACEDGDVEYDTEKLKTINASVATIDTEAEFNTEHLQEIADQYRPDVVFVEYNGTWGVGEVYEMELPKNWVIVQSLATVDATTFEMYMANMRSMMMEQFFQAEVVIFNRCDGIEDLNTYKRNVKALNQTAEIIFEDQDGEIDEIMEEDLPYDLKADKIVLDDNTYGIWYLDSLDHVDRYVGKTIEFIGMVMKPEEFPKGYFVPGRMAMTCCAEDMTFLGFACVYDKIDLYQERDWVKVTAVVKKEYFADYEGEGPVLYAESVTKAKQPKEPVISFT